MPATFYANGVDLATYKLYVEDPQGWHDTVARTVPLVDVPGEPDALLGATPAYKGRKLTVLATLAGSSVADFRTQLDAVKYLLWASTLTVKVDDGASPARQLAGTAERVTVRPKGGAPTMTHTADVEVVVACAQAFWHAPSATTLAINTTATAVPLGTARSASAVLTITGAATSPITITYKNSAGTTVQALVVAQALGAGDTLVLDLSRKLLTKTISAVSSSAVSAITSGDFFALDPRDGDFNAAAWPTLQVDKGTSSLTHTKAYL